MHYWRIEELKDEIRERGMADDDVISYFVGSTGVAALAGGVPLLLPGPWNWVMVGWEVMLGFFGTFYLYQANRGRMGQLFLQRYFALGWVIGMRWITMCALIFSPIVAAFRFIPEMPAVPPWGPVSVWMVAILVLYWRVAFHLRELSRSD